MTDAPHGGTSPQEEITWLRDQVAGLREQLATASGAASEAYRDSARLVRVLTVMSQPSSPDRLMDDALAALSEVFNADLTVIARSRRGRLVVTNACGLPEDDEAFVAGWPVGTTVRRVLAGGGATARDGAGLDGDLTPELADMGIRSAAWIPLWTGPGTGDELLMLYRRAPNAFTATELQLLESIAFRLSLTVEARERSVAAERLADSGHRLARHLDTGSLFDEAARIFAGLAGAASVWITQVDGDRVTLLAAHGVTRPVAGTTAGLPGWSLLRASGTYCDTASVDGAELSTLALPVSPAGDGPVTLLHAFRDPRRPFLGDAVETAHIFANYLRAAAVNAALYHQLRQSESSLRLITDSISDLIGVVDADGRFRYASPSHERELAHDPDLLLGTGITDLTHPEDAPVLRDALCRAPESPKVEYRLQTGRDTWVWVESALRPAPSGDGTVVISSRVIDDRRRLEDELRRRATHDPLTGLANRTLAGQRIDEALASDDRSPVGLLFCDLDRFKAVNDRLGHEAGDELLRLVAGRLRRCLREGDLLARFGGDEFVFLLDGVHGLDDVDRVGRRVTETLAEPILLRGEWHRLSVSVGGVCGVRGRTTASAMLRDADAAMYAAKEQGRGRVEVFDEAASSRSLARLDLRSDLPHALDRSQLAVHYQPIFDLAGGRIVGFEALLRWRHPAHGAVPPDVFIPLAEETGAIVAIGDWVLGRACRQLAAWQGTPAGRPADRPLWISVNLSATQLSEPGLAGRTLETIAGAGVDPADVWLEVTEHSAVRTDVTELATTLRRAGVHFSLDDFGISYSNLGHLTRFPVECLKIDKSFVRGIAEPGPDHGIVRAVLAIAESLGLRVVAEGVETAEQRGELLRLRCQLGQGYLLSRPVPPEEATALLTEDARLAPA